MLFYFKSSRWFKSKTNKFDMTALNVILLFIVRWSHVPVMFQSIFVVVMRNLNRSQVACGSSC